MESHVLAAAAAAPIITALVAAVGMAVPRIPRRAYPVVAVVLGVGWCVLLAAGRSDVGWATLVEGIVAGLTASGLYSAAIKPIAERVGL